MKHRKKTGYCFRCGEKCKVPTWMYCELCDYEKKPARYVAVAGRKKMRDTTMLRARFPFLPADAIGYNQESDVIIYD